MTTNIRQRNRAVESPPGLLDRIGGLLSSYFDSGNPWFSPNHLAAIASREIEEYKARTGITDPRDPYISERLDSIGSSVGVDPSGFGGGLLGTVKRVVPPKNPLIVQHNIHPKAVERAERIGGIPSPSIAISKADDPLTTFGDISLVGTPEMAIPSGRNPVYRSDAYSSRMPTIEIVPDDKSLELVKKFYGKEITHSPELKDIFREIWSQEWNHLESPLLKEAFLKSKGIKVPKLRFKKTDTWEQQHAKSVDHHLFLRDLMKPFENSWQVQPWLKRQRKRIEKGGGAFSERVWRGRSDITGSERWSAATVENIVKEMKKGAGQEHTVQSMGSLRARVAPKFKSLPQIKKSRDKIVSKDVFKEAKDKLSDELDDITSDLRDTTNKHFAETIGESTAENLYHTASATTDQLVEDILVSTPRRSDYVEGLVDLIKPETIEKARVLRQKMKNMPTEYFEAKPRRGVDLSEFKGALVPKDMDSTIKKILKKSGVKKILEYGSNEERKRLFKKFPELMFGLLPPALVGGLLGSQGESNAQ